MEGGWKLKIAGVVIDDWKLPVFKRHLDAAGRTYTEGPGITADTVLLKVQYEWVADLKPIIEAANKKCSEKTQSNG